MSRLLFLFLTLLGLALTSTSFAASPTTGDLTGIVRDAKNKPVPYVRVRFSGPVEGSVRTDLNGSYQVPDLLAGSYDLFFQKPGYTAVHRGPFQVVANQGHTLNVALAWAQPGAGAIEVRVQSRDRRAPLPETTVDLLQNGFPIAQTQTDETGTTVFPGVQTGTYRLLARRPGFNEARSVNFAVRAGQMTVAVLQLTQNKSEVGRLSGTVRAPGGAAISGAKVKIIQGYATAQVSTPASGRYEFTRLVPGRYALEVSANGFQTQTVGNLQVQALQVTTRDITMIPNAASEGSISGRIVDEEGNGIPARVTVTAGSALGTEVTTGADGRYTLPNLDPGTFSLIAEADGRQTAGRSGIQVRAGFTSVVDLELLPRTAAPGSLSGQVREAGTGALLSGVVVEILGGPSAGLATTTDESGGYLLPGIVPSEGYLVRFSKDDYAPFRQFSVQIDPGVRSTLSVSLTPQQVTIGNLEGSVRLRGAALQADVKVTLFQGPTSPLATRTDREGRFTFKNLKAGNNYGLRLEKQGLVTLTRTGITITAGRVTRLGELVMNRTADVGGLRVVVLDLAGRPIAKAGVTITSGPTLPPRAETDTSGRALFQSLPSGVYAVEVVANGYQNGRKANINVSAGRVSEAVVQLLR